jgi:hypothetical protein
MRQTTAMEWYRLFVAPVGCHHLLVARTQEKEEKAQEQGQGKEGEEKSQARGVTGVTSCTGWCVWNCLADSCQGFLLFAMCASNF